jgi:hypothetical protein
MAEFKMDVRMHYFQTIKEQRDNPDFLVRNEMDAGLNNSGMTF